MLFDLIAPNFVICHHKCCNFYFCSRLFVILTSLVFDQFNAKYSRKTTRSSTSRRCTAGQQVAKKVLKKSCCPKDKGISRQRLSLTSTRHWVSAAAILMITWTIRPPKERLFAALPRRGQKCPLHRRLRLHRQVPRLLLTRAFPPATAMMWRRELRWSSAWSCLVPIKIAVEHNFFFFCFNVLIMPWCWMWLVTVVLMMAANVIATSPIFTELNVQDLTKKSLIIGKRVFLKFRENAPFR